MVRKESDYTNPIQLYNELYKTSKDTRRCSGKSISLSFIVVLKFNKITSIVIKKNLSVVKTIQDDFISWFL